MIPENLQHICACFSSLFRVPVYILEEDQVVESFIPRKCSYRISLASLNNAPFSDNSIRFSFSNHGILCAMIDVLGTEYQVLVGAAKSIPLSSVQHSEVISELDVPTLLRKEISKELDDIPYISDTRYINAISLLNTAINQQVLRTEEFYKTSFSLELPVDEKDEDEVRQIGEEKEIGHRFEQMLVHCISNGFVDQLVALTADGSAFGGSIAIVGDSSIQQSKIIAHTVITIASRAAVTGGLLPAIAYPLSDLYFRQAEHCTKKTDFDALTITVMRDFCQRVHDFKMAIIPNRLVRKTIQYITVRLTEDISVEELAATQGYSTGYLSRTFRECTGMTIPQYINQQRVLRAKNLLVNTNLSLAEIAYRLGYPSQSYFQTIFRSVASTTPGQYRKANHVL